MVPDYGFIKWCNMTGQYITIVAHGVPTVDLSLCNLGVFGNVHIR